MGVSSSLLPGLSRAARIMRDLPGGRGLVEGGALVFAGHRVSPRDPGGIRANEELKISPTYLDFFVRRLRACGYTFVSLDALAEVVRSGRKTRGLVCLTFDDGYRDNLENALPVLEALETPFAIYMLCAWSGRETFFWWLALDSFLRARSFIRLADGKELSCATPEERERVFLRLRRRVLEKACLDPRSFLLNLLPEFASALPSGKAERHLLDPVDLRFLGARRLVTIGCHTVSHPNLSRLADSEAYNEILASKRCLEEMTGTVVRHFAFPFGGLSEAGAREYRMASRAGFTTAATMVAGSVPRNNADLLCRLPRIPVLEGADPLQLIAENRARAWIAGVRGLLPL